MKTLIDLLFVGFLFTQCIERKLQASIASISPKELLGIFADTTVSFTNPQYFKNDLRVSWGGPTAYAIGVASTQVLSFGLIVKEVKGSSGALAISYNRFISKRLSVGFTWAREALTIFYTSSYETADIKINSYMIGCKFYYANKNSFQVYSGISYGKSSVRGSPETNSEKSDQMTFLGFRFGEHIAFISEIGYGYEGLIKLGLSGRF
ncbi:MAG: hypothetical protein KF687_18425 [Cyclobacteriaceae bacterium]|nr:hypothetical protein [Cyclobacteriaceae bacterium]